MRSGKRLGERDPNDYRSPLLHVRNVTVRRVSIGRQQCGFRVAFLAFSCGFPVAPIVVS